MSVPIPTPTFPCYYSKIKICQHNSHCARTYIKQRLRISNTMIIDQAIERAIHTIIDVVHITRLLILSVFDNACSSALRLSHDGAGECECLGGVEATRFSNDRHVIALGEVHIQSTIDDGSHVLKRHASVVVARESATDIDDVHTMSDLVTVVEQITGVCYCSCVC